MKYLQTTYLKLHIFLICICTVSCQKSSYIENELHGLWQVTKVEEKNTGRTIQPQGDTYYSFQRNMVMLGYKSPNRPTGVIAIGETTTTYYVSDFYLENNSIQMGDFRIYMYYDKKAPANMLTKFGIYDDHTTFAIERPNKNALIFESDKARITMRKY